MLGTGLAKKLGLGNLATKIINWKNNLLLKSQLKNQSILVKQRNKTKIFVIGFNKTGTTSVEKALSEFDLILGHQRTAERLMLDVVKEEMGSLNKYCLTAEAFQDVPFSAPYVFKHLDTHYPNSKFVLTIRDSDEQWFNSIVRFHSKLWGENGLPPTQHELEKANYVTQDYALKVSKFMYGDELYNEKIYKSIYNNHNKEVISYFKDRPDDLLVVNVAKKEDYKKFCNFIGENPLHDSFSWENKTAKQ